MAAIVLIDIDLATFRANLTNGDGRERTDAETREVLIEAGFKPTPEGWVAEEIMLRWLNAEEVRSVRRVG